MKRFLIFRLATFQRTAALCGVQALIPAPGSIIDVSCGSPGPTKSMPIAYHASPCPTHLARGGFALLCDSTQKKKQSLAAQAL